MWFALAVFVLLLGFLLLIVLSLFFNFYLFVLLWYNLVWLRIGDCVLCCLYWLFCMMQGGFAVLQFGVLPGLV